MKSAKYSYWLSVSDLRRCGSCKELQGKVFTKDSSNPLSASFFPLKPPLHLPAAAGRIWYEADINYDGGFRGTDRILYSNDGLIFVTYDHYRTFIEII